MLFCGLLLISNIGATKLIQLGPIITDGGAILFPLTYIFGDVLSEVYGFRKARRAIFLGFGLSILASLTFWIVQIAPAADAYENQAAFEAVLGFVPRIVLASLCGFLAGQLLNAYVLVKIKERTKEKQAVGTADRLHPGRRARRHRRLLHDRVLRRHHRR